MAYTKRFIISFGGSLISTPDGVAIDFLQNFSALLRQTIQDHPDWQIFLVTGGGYVCRQYQAAVQALLPSATDLEKDWMGIYTTRFHAHFMQLAFQDIAHEKIIEDYAQKQEASEQLVIASGWHPGTSTDMDAVLLAEQYEATVAINLSNIAYVYDKDPKQFPDAKRIEHMTWNELRAIVGDTWSPGLNTPFDPIAAKKAQELGLTVIVAEGKNLENVQHILNAEAYVGTTITP